MLKLSGTASGLPARGQSPCSRSRSGRPRLPLDDRSQTIVPRRFFLGGATTMRGYAEEEMIPQDVRAEYLAARRGSARRRPGSAACQGAGAPDRAAASGRSRRAARRSCSGRPSCAPAARSASRAGSSPTSATCGSTRSSRGSGPARQRRVRAALRRRRSARRRSTSGFNITPDDRLDERVGRAALHHRVLFVTGRAARPAAEPSKDVGRLPGTAPSPRRRCRRARAERPRGAVAGEGRAPAGEHRVGGVGGVPVAGPVAADRDLVPGAPAARARRSPCRSRRTRSPAPWNATSSPAAAIRRAVRAHLEVGAERRREPVQDRLDVGVEPRRAR